MNSLGRIAVGAPLVLALGAMASGIALADWLAVPPGAAGAALAVGLGLTGVAVHAARGSLVAALGSTVAAGALAAALAPTPRGPAAGCHDPGELWRATVAEVAGRAWGLAGELERPVVLELGAERCGGQWRPRRERVRVRLRGEDALARGDRLELRLRLAELPIRRNPTDPDPRQLARRDGLTARAVVRSPHVVTRHARGLLAWIDRARDAASARLEALPADLATVAKALANGDQTAVDDEMRERWAGSGLAHLLSVSGLHVTIVAAIVFFVATRLLVLLPGFGERWSVRRTAALCALGPVVLFCLWAGAPPAAVRATVMGAALLAGLAIGRRGAVLDACGLAGVLILAASPASLYDPGFGLSFAAILFLLALPSRPAARGRWAAARRAAAGLFAASVVATLATAPVTAHFFGRVSVVGPLANLVGVPLGSTVATPLALAYDLGSAVSPRVGRLLAVPLEIALRALDRLAGVAAGLPFASVDVPSPTLLESAAFYVALLAAVTAGGRRRGRRVAVLAVAVVAASAAARAGLAWRDRRLVVSHPYVGQGSATLVRLPDGEHVLVDAGGSSIAGGPDPGLRTVAPLLRSRGVRTLDLAVLTHPHPDHLGGFRYVAAHFPIRELWWSGEGEELPAVRSLVEAVRAGGGAVRTAAELPERVRRGGVEIHVVHPRPGPEAEGLPFDPTLSTNDNSVVLRIVHGARSFVLPGDIEAGVEARLSPLLPPTDVLHAGHHGSRTSSSASLLAAVRPWLVVVSVGENNRFGFPDPGVLRRYAGAGATVLRTDVDGLVEIESDGTLLRAHTASGRVIAPLPPAFAPGAPRRL